MAGRDHVCLRLHGALCAFELENLTVLEVNRVLACKIQHAGRGRRVGAFAAISRQHRRATSRSVPNAAVARSKATLQPFEQRLFKSSVPRDCRELECRYRRWNIDPSKHGLVGCGDTTSVRGLCSGTLMIIFREFGFCKELKGMQRRKEKQTARMLVMGVPGMMNRKLRAVLDPIIG